MLDDGSRGVDGCVAKVGGVRETVELGRCLGIGVGTSNDQVEVGSLVLTDVGGLAGYEGFVVEGALDQCSRRGVVVGRAVLGVGGLRIREDYERVTLINFPSVGSALGLQDGQDTHIC